MDNVTVAPLSYQQAEMVRNIVNHPDCSDRYDFVCVFRLRGEVDRDCLAGAIEDVMVRHASLRTVIRRQDGELMQVVHPEPTMALTLRHWPDMRLHTVLDTLLAERHGAEEVLSGAPLFRPQLHDMEEGLLISFTVHHLVYDGWSLSVLWRDLSECYAARLERRDAVLPELSYSYADFAIGQRAAPEGMLREAVAHWSQAVARCPSELVWPLRADAPAGASPKTLAYVPLELPPETVGDVRSAASRARVSPAAVLLAATAVGVARLTGQRELLFGTDTANREDRRKKNLVGHCVNSRLAVINAETGRPLLELAQGVWHQWAAGEKYREVYSDQLLQGLGSPRMFKVNVQNELVDGGSAPVLSGAEVSQVHAPTRILDWRPLSVVWRVAATGLAARFAHQPARVGREQVDELSGQLLDLLGDPLAII